MQWPTVGEISAMAPLPEGYRFERMTRSDIGPLIEGIREWFPSVSVGAASCYLTEQFYLDKVVLDDQPDKDVIALLIRKDGELVGMGSWERESAAMTLYARLGVISPAHRGARMAVIAMELGEKMGRAMGAGFIYTLATMKMPQMQLALERAGYQLIGFMPGYDREEVSPGVVKRVFEAGYAKRLAPAEEFLRPEDKNMTPNVKRLFDIIFPPNQ
jgi:hypothetical protein